MSRLYSLSNVVLFFSLHNAHTARVPFPCKRSINVCRVLSSTYARFAVTTNFEKRTLRRENSNGTVAAKLFKTDFAANATKKLEKLKHFDRVIILYGRNRLPFNFYPAGRDHDPSSSLGRSKNFPSIIATIR